MTTEIKQQTLAHQKNKIKLRQICFVFIALMPVNKLSLLPSVLASFAEEQIWLSAMVIFALDILVLWAILTVSKRHRDKTYYSILSENGGEPIAKTIFFLYGIYFFIKATLPLLEQKYYIENVLYEISPNIIVFYPFFLVSFYACLKGLKALGRCADIAVWITIVGLFLTIFLSVGAGDYTNLLPFLQKPIYKPVIGGFKNLAWFSESVYMLFFLGHFATEKNQNSKVLLSYGITAFVVTLFLTVFFAIFGPIAKAQPFAASHMTIFTVSLANLGRFDYIAVFLLLFSQVYAIMLPIFLATKCFERVFKVKRAYLIAIIVNAAMLINMIILDNKIYSVLSFFQAILPTFFILMGYIVPVLTLILPKSSPRILKESAK